MTSSLVGSEMCIRDSAGRAVTVVRRLEKPPSGSGLSPLHRPTNVDESVSYTHLTLPTICSV
eukprot:8458955-Prorocentrum_lima.AAC.1